MYGARSTKYLVGTEYLTVNNSWMDSSINQDYHVFATEYATGQILCTPCARLIIIFGNLNQLFSPADWIGLYLPRGAMDFSRVHHDSSVTPGVKRGLSPLRLVLKYAMMDSSGFRPIKYVQHSIIMFFFVLNVTFVNSGINH